MQIKTISPCSVLIATLHIAIAGEALEEGNNDGSDCKEFIEANS